MKLLESQQSGNKPTKEGVEIRRYDVLCGRGKHSFDHDGNRDFRYIIAAVLPDYVSAKSRGAKTAIVASVMKKVHAQGGRFLRHDSNRNVWYVLNYSQSKDKVGHAIRDATLTKEAKKVRAQKRREIRAAARKASCKSTTSLQPDCRSVTPDYHQAVRFGELRQEEQNHFVWDDFDHIKTLEDYSSPQEALSSMLTASIPERLFQNESYSAASIEPISTTVDQDPFKSYINDLLGPIMDAAEFPDF